MTFVNKYMGCNNTKYKISLGIGQGAPLALQLFMLFTCMYLVIQEVTTIMFIIWIFLIFTSCDQL